MRPLPIAAAAALLASLGTAGPSGDASIQPIASISALSRSGPHPRPVLPDLASLLPPPASATPAAAARAAPAPASPAPAAPPSALSAAEVEAVLLGSWLAPAFAVLIAPPPPPPVVVASSPSRSSGSSGYSAPVASSGYTGGGTGGLDGVLACIRNHESTNNYSATNGIYRGAYQFDYSTWQSVGGSGDPAAASPAEQDHRAAVLYGQRGINPWPNAQC